MADYAIDEIHAEACQMEHAISDRLADRLEVMLGYPKVDPHGHPIPTKDGLVTIFNHQLLVNVSSKETVVIRQVSDWDFEHLRYLRELGLVPGTKIEILEIAPFNGPLTLKVGEKTIALAQEIAEEIGVSP